MKVKTLKNMLFQPLSVSKKAESLTVEQRGRFTCRQDEETPQIRALILKGDLDVVSEEDDGKPDTIVPHAKKSIRPKVTPVVTPVVGKIEVTSTDAGGNNSEKGDDSLTRTDKKKKNRKKADSKPAGKAN